MEPISHPARIKLFVKLNKHKFILMVNPYMSIGTLCGKITNWVRKNVDQAYENIVDGVY